MDNTFDTCGELSHCCLINKVKVTSFGRVAFSYSAVQPLFDIQLPLVIGLQKESPWGNYFTPGLIAAKMRHQGISNLHRHRPLRGVTIHTLVEWSVGDSFLVPIEIHIRSLLDSKQEPLDLQSNALSLGQRSPQMWKFLSSVNCLKK